MIIDVTMCVCVLLLLVIVVVVFDMCGYSFSEKYVVALQQMGLPKDNEKINQTFVTFTVCNQLFMCDVHFVLYWVCVCVCVCVCLCIVCVSVCVLCECVVCVLCECVVCVCCVSV